jgi:hypothetical protein
MEYFRNEHLRYFINPAILLAVRMPGISFTHLTDHEHLTTNHAGKPESTGRLCRDI